MASNSSESVNKYNFVEEPGSALECVICLDVAEDPRQHVGLQCGRLFCKECLKKLGNKPCPNCRGEDPQYFEDHKSKREIKALPVKCSNMGRVCEWVGTVGTLEKHVATCEFALVPCRKECKDDNEAVKCFMRKDRDKHLENDCPNRDHECESCGEKSTYAYITEVHDKTCKMKMLSCPNAGCKIEIQRQHISEHVSKCPHTVISCKYKSIGCDTEMKREDMAAHEQDDKLHLHMALDTVNSQQHEFHTLKNKESITFCLSGYQKKKGARKIFISPSFYSHPNGYHMALAVDADGWGAGKGTHTSVTLPIIEGKFDSTLKWPFLGTITVTLLNQIEDKKHHTLTMTFTALEETHALKNARSAGARGSPQFIPHSALAHDPVKNKYLKDDTLYFRVEVEVADHKPWLQCTIAEVKDITT